LIVLWPQPQRAQQQAANAGGGQSAPTDTNAAVEKNNGTYIMVWRSIMAPKNVADAFGRRIARHYIAMQVTIANRNKDYQWLIQNAAIDVRRLLTQETERNGKCEPNTKLLLQALEREVTDAKGDKSTPAISPLLKSPYNSVGDATRVTSADLTVLRGVAEKGQSLDPRNVAVRSLTGAGVIAAGLIGVMRVGHSYAPGVAAFNGAFLTAVQEILPDYTVNQLNRLNDSAFLANTVVGKQQAKVIVIFIPQSDLLTSKQQKAYYKDPESVYGCPDLRMLEANVDGNFVANVTGAPVVTAVNIDSSEVAKFQQDNFTVKGSAVGNFFANATIDLVSPPKGVSVKLDGTPTDTAVKFILSGTTPIPPDTLLEFAVKGSTGDPTHATYRVSYTAPKPTLTSMDPATVKAGESSSITLKGSHFLPDGMAVVLNPSAGITVGPLQFTSSTEMKFEVTAASAAAAGSRSLKVSGPTGLSDTSLSLTVAK
jgi:hypothetical protein